MCTIYKAVLLMIFLLPTQSYAVGWPCIIFTNLFMKTQVRELNDWPEVTHLIHPPSWQIGDQPLVPASPVQSPFPTFVISWALRTISIMEWFTFWSSWVSMWASWGQSSCVLFPAAIPWTFKCLAHRRYKINRNYFIA